MNAKKMPAPRRNGGTGGNRNQPSNFITNEAVSVNKLPPADVEAEAALFSLLIGWPGGIEAARAILEPEDFSLRGYQILFEMLSQFDAQGRKWTPTTLHDAFDGHPEGERIQRLIAELGPFWTLRDNGPVRHYARIIKEQAIRRDGIRVLVSGAESLFQQSESPEEIFIKVGEITGGLIQRLEGGVHV
ncbi:hypothetical protein UR09_03970 [Candidatus Nitromaritima sp. SCGC AAA799-A02]|nr:hypothetical protein UR09_03970 [Candidatus Nitromaritima sp. SCGC AAA799-A02]